MRIAPDRTRSSTSRARSTALSRTSAARSRAAWARSRDTSTRGARKRSPPRPTTKPNWSPRSPSSTAMSRSPPSRRIVRSATRPAGVSPTRRCSWATLSTRSPFQRTITSPSAMPASAAGPSSTRPETWTPYARAIPASAARSSSMSTISTPSHPPPPENATEIRWRRSSSSASCAATGATASPTATTTPSPAATTATPPAPNDLRMVSLIYSPSGSAPLISGMCRRWPEGPPFPAGGGRSPLPCRATSHGDGRLPRRGDDGRPRVSGRA